MTIAERGNAADLVPRRLIFVFGEDKGE